jgi:RNA polymerase sigma factor (sigma-70 family)
MTRDELKNLRDDLLCNDSEQLKTIYLKYKDDCVGLLIAKMHISSEKAEDIFIDALLVLRQNIISERITKLSSVKSYLSSTCINMVRESWTYDSRIRKKEQNVRLLFYENNHKHKEEVMDEEELRKIAMKALSRLSDKCRSILIAFYVYKTPMKEIAEEFGFSSADVAKMTKSRCFKAWLKEVKSLMS